MKRKMAVCLLLFLAGWGAVTAEVSTHKNLVIGAGVSAPGDGLGQMRAAGGYCFGTIDFLGTEIEAGSSDANRAVNRIGVNRITDGRSWSQFPGKSVKSLKLCGSAVLPLTGISEYT